jgi:hypothetical protein
VTESAFEHVPPEEDLCAPRALQVPVGDLHPAVADAVDDVGRHALSDELLLLRQPVGAVAVGLADLVPVVDQREEARVPRQIVRVTDQIAEPMAFM